MRNCLFSSVSYVSVFEQWRNFEMIRDYQFKDIEKYLKKDSEIGKDILEAFESLSNAAIIFSPVMFGVHFLPMLELLDVKDKLFNLGHKVYDFITQKIELDYIDRTEQLRAAYALICYTAYFDVLSDALPNGVRKKLKLKFEKKRELIEESTEDIIVSPSPNIHCKVFYADHVTSFSDIKKHLHSIYNRVTNGLIKMIVDASIFDENKEKDEQEFKQLKAMLEGLPEKALEVYEAQYLKLADQFNDFALFAQLQNFEGIQNAIAQNKDALDLLFCVTKRIDVGLTNLNGIVNSIVTNYNAIQAQDIVDDLKRKYISIIEEPIIDDKEIKSNSEIISLRFPKIVDAFIPQSYKCLLYQRKETKLEDSSIWKQLPVQNDLDKFFVKYLYSPDSIDYPLVILGQPGSGKSLLTKVLSAQLMSTSYTVIRIPLREVNAEDGIDVLVEDQIKKLTNRPLSTQGYGGFAAQFNEKPLIIILDGYDELLQAKGDVFSGYLEKVRTFQQDQKSMKRPVRIIITSRITLIDKARIPENSTILRLMEFDQQQRQVWITIWNQINADYFANSKINPFSLPAEEKGRKNSIIELAEQPLLLLMLALYDSEANELAQTSNIKRTELYDNLLRRFVRRERRRYVPGFADKPTKEQEEIIDQEMNRLGVVAIGMYNRQEVVILSRQLEGDLDTFKARRSDGSPKPHTLKESESVLGGFFFIHKSTAKDVDAHSDDSESAFEFLHNTFGEFLAADFILRNTINEVKDIIVDRKYKSSGLTNKLENPDSFNSGWFYCLMFEPLYSRPVVIEMLREHSIKALQRASNSIDVTYNDFMSNLKFIVQNQLKMILNTRNSPSVMRNGTLFDRDISLLGYLSTYSLNLIILACALSSDEFEFNEEEYYNSETSELDLKPWDKLASLWKAWFSPADLAGLSVILKAKRKHDTVVQIKCNEKFEATRYEQPIDILLCISSTLADHLLTGLSGLQTQQFCEIARVNDDEIREILGRESSDLYFSYLITLLRKEINSFSNKRKKRGIIKADYQKINRIIDNIIQDERLHNVNSDTLLNLFVILECCLARDMIFLSTRRNLMRVLPRLIEINLKRLESPEVMGGIRLLQLLIADTNPLSLDRRMIYDRPFDRNISILQGADWAEEIDRIIHYAFRHTRSGSGRFSIHGFEGNNTYQMSLLDIIENSPTLATEDIAEALEQFVAPDSLEILLKTNPELLSRAILILLKNDVTQQTLPSTVTNMFLEGCLNQLSSVGISYFGLNAIINAISIARYVNAEHFLRKIAVLLHDQLFGRHPEFFSSIIYLYPTFISNLIDIMPEIFSDDSPVVIDAFFFEKRIRYVESEKLLDYIKVIRYFSQLKDKKHNYRKMAQMLFRNIRDSDYLRKIDYNQLTIGQLNDLIWFADTIDDRLVSTKIKEILSHYPFSNSYGRNDFLKYKK